MVRSWIHIGLMAGFVALGFLLLRGLAAESTAYAREFALAGGFYTVAFALRVSI